MLKRSLAVAFTIVLSISGVVANAAPKSNGYAPSAGPYTRCEPEPGLKGDAKKLQEFLSSINSCITANRLGDTTLSKVKPKTTTSDLSKYATLSTCKLPQASVLKEYRGFNLSNDPVYNSKRHPGAGSVIQVIGVSAPDAPAGPKLPSVEYKYYLDLAKKWFASVNNSEKPVTIRVADKWYDYGSNFAPLQLSHMRMTESASIFSQRVIDISDADINFSDVNYVIVVVPAATKFDVISQSGLRSARSSESQISNISLAMPANFTKYQQNNFTGFLNFTMWLHELYHPGFNMGDQVGDGKWLFRGQRANLPGEDANTWPYASAAAPSATRWR